jgi:hypothetical protein
MQIFLLSFEVNFSRWSTNVLVGGLIKVLSLQTILCLASYSRLKRAKNNVHDRINFNAWNKIVFEGDKSLRSPSIKEADQFCALYTAN